MMHYSVELGLYWTVQRVYERKSTRARICKRFKRPGIDSKGLNLPVYRAWRAGTSNRVVVPAREAGNRSLGFLKRLQIRAQKDMLDVMSTLQAVI
jgi:hypothetical protein